MEPSRKPTFAGTAMLLWRAARQRARGRAQRQREILRQRRGTPGIGLGVFAYPLLMLLALILQVLFAISVNIGIRDALPADFESHGKMIVSPALMGTLAKAQRPLWGNPKEVGPELAAAFWKEAQATAPQAKQPVAKRDSVLQAQYERFGPAGFVSTAVLWEPHSRVLGKFPCPLAAVVGLMILGWWFLMLVFQGEGSDLDVQRRRHPMWEWLFSHPVKPGAAFFSEMLSPFAVNPIVTLAPVFFVTLFLLNGRGGGASILLGTAVGLPLAVAAACLGKAIEIYVLLRFPIRSRGAVMGLISWLGFVLSVGIFFTSQLHDDDPSWARSLEPMVSHVNAPIFDWLIGGLGGAWWWGFPLAAAWTFSLFIIAIALCVAGRTTARGMAGGEEASAGPKPTQHSRSVEWLGDPLYRKELLWFWRDRGAVVQAILIPLSVAGFQLFNARGLLIHTGGQWRWICAAAVVFGTYFLLFLGPRSLLSEGPAFWIAQTWPRGIESLLKAKARLWWLLASVPVAGALILATTIHPLAWWKVVLVAIGWYLFSRSLAEKAVTLAQPSSSSGEAEPMSRSRRSAAYLGTFTFATGIASQQWNLAIVGVVYSWFTAAAMWQNFRARLPFLFDPWSETPPRPPTLMHGMVAIFIMVEILAVVSGIAIGLGGASVLWMAQMICYGVIGALTWLGTRRWLSQRGVSDREIWNWNSECPPTVPQLWSSIALGILCGGTLAICARGYLRLLSAWWPEFGKSIAHGSQYFSHYPDQRVWLILLTVVCAPLAEEYLFRGLLFRALDREWGGWRAIVGSAAFFAIYHPPTSWLPVAALGILNAWLFRSRGSLWPCVAAHATYNLLIVLR